ncbi:MAG: GlsB/YeaQ/YmgE family stress response membrane protein [Thiotrichales bacterium]
MNAEIIDLLILLGIGAVAGWIAGQVMRGGGFGLIGNIIVGIVGAVVGTLLGGFISGATGIQIHGWLGTLIWATIGAIVLLFIIGLLKRKV